MYINDVQTFIHTLQTEEACSNSRDGSGFLEDVIKEVKDKPPDDKNKERYEYLCTESLKHLNEMDEVALNNFRWLVSGARLPRRRIGKDIYELLFNDKIKIGVEKRKILLLVLNDLEYVYVPSQLLREVEVKDAYPLVWADLMMPLDWSEAFKAAEKGIKEKADFIVLHIEYWSKTSCPKEELKKFLNKHFDYFDENIKKFIKILFP